MTDLDKLKQDHIRSELRSSIGREEDARRSNTIVDSQFLTTDLGHATIKTDQEGRVHRTDYELDRTTKKLDGKLHHIEGPAIVWETGAVEWWHQGAYITGRSSEGKFDRPMYMESLRGDPASMPLSKIIGSMDIASSLAEAKQRASTGVVPTLDEGTHLDFKKWRAAREGLQDPNASHLVTAKPPAP